MSAVRRGRPRRLGSLARHAAAVAALTAWAAAAVLPAVAQPASPPVSVQQTPLPPGLAAVWRVAGRKVAERVSAWSLAAFSTDGRHVGVSDESGTRVYRASDGHLLRAFPAPLATGQFAYSLAISSTGLVAMGRVGGTDVFDLESRSAPSKYHCGGICGPVSALAFSPNGAWLASQAAGALLDTSRSSVNVVDVRKRAVVAELEASATRAGVMFAADGRTLTAANVTRIDDYGTFGVRSWNGSADWRRVRDEPGAQLPPGSIGPYAFDERVAAYARDGRLELRTFATGELVWAVPLVPPGLDGVAAEAPMRLELVALARGGDVVLSYEAPAAGAAPGTLVLRRMADGSTAAMYDVAGVSSIAVAPEGDRFLYSTGTGRTQTVLARIPR